MFINKLPFLASIIRRLKFTTIEYLSRNNEIALLSSIHEIVSYYRSHGLHVFTLFIDPEFKSLEEKAVSTALNKTGHVTTSQR